MSNMFDEEVRVIYSDDEGIEITKVYFPNMSSLSYVMYDDNEISVSFDYTNLIFKEGLLSKFNEMMESDDIDDFLVKATKKSMGIIREQYKKGVKKNSPHTAFLYHNKRDLTRQIYVALDNHIFDELTMYEYICDSYSVIECGYGYDKLFNRLEELKNGDYADEITTKIIESLDDKVKDDYIEVYRGINNRNREEGLSYTFNLETAKFFANRWGDEGVVKKYKVNVDYVVAYIDNGEDEILTDNAEYICDVDIDLYKAN